MVGVYQSRFQVGVQNYALLEISHLFANDPLTMCGANQDQIYNLGHILMCFEAILGLSTPCKLLKQKLNLKRKTFLIWSHF
jgi:hypothetical protein